ERILLNSIANGKKTPSQIPLSKDELQVSIGILKKLGAITIEATNPLTFALTEAGKTWLKKKTLEEQFLNTLTQPRDLEGLRPEERKAFETLLARRNIVRVVEKKLLEAELTERGKKIGPIKATQLIGRLTPDMLSSGSWKRASFKAYDVSSPVPRLDGGKRHILYQAIEYIRRIWLEMGFVEMTGRLVQQSFWNFDALFTAQDHPVRDIHDTFFLKDPRVGQLPAKQLVERVRKTHENGWTTGSKGWGYTWNPDEAKRNVMRTHTTVLSARTLAALTPKDIPGKFFAVARNFRNETVDWGHSCEFYQVEGIVVSKDVTFKHLLGYLREYYKKLGYDKVRFRPAYFPYTEMSVEAEVYNKERATWVEVGGAGIFRPEVVKPLLGQDIPVLAWGQGLERGIMEHLGINDLREIYANDLGKLKEMGVWYK
ncbi:phenylalanine--tRNA ligase subunit alpha, partial [Candidatus Woesearchaeota archaeon]